MLTTILRYERPIPQREREYYFTYGKLTVFLGFLGKISLKIYVKATSKLIHLNHSIRKKRPIKYNKIHILFTH